jgi:hypothetical protein
VRQAGGQLAQRQQPLPLAHELGGVPLPDEHPLEQVHRHRVPLPEDRGEGPGGQGEEPAVGHRADRRGVPLLEPVAEIELDRSGVDAAVVGAHRLDLAAPHEADHAERPLQEHEEALRRLALDRHLRAGRAVDDVAVVRHPGQLVVAEVLEEEEPPQLVEGQPLLGRRHRSSRYR